MISNALRMSIFIILVWIFKSECASLQIKMKYLLLVFRDIFQVIVIKILSENNILKSTKKCYIELLILTYVQYSNNSWDTYDLNIAMKLHSHYGF